MTEDGTKAQPAEKDTKPAGEKRKWTVKVKEVENPKDLPEGLRKKIDSAKKKK